MLHVKIQFAKFPILPYIVKNENLSDGVFDMQMEYLTCVLYSYKINYTFWCPYAMLDKFDF